MARWHSRRATVAVAFALMLVHGHLHGPNAHQALDWPRVRVPDPVALLTIRTALDDAWRWLAERDCRGLLTEFRDEANRSLEQRLGLLSVDPQTYLTWVWFVDGSRKEACHDGVFAFTSPGSRVVFLCLGEVKRTGALSPRLTTAYFIHEMLHSLGLGENPPTPSEINKRVLSACAPRT